VLDIDIEEELQAQHSAAPVFTERLLQTLLSVQPALRRPLPISHHSTGGERENKKEGQIERDKTRRSCKSPCTHITRLSLILNIIVYKCYFLFSKIIQIPPNRRTHLEAGCFTEYVEMPPPNAG